VGDAVPHPRQRRDVAGDGNLEALADAGPELAVARGEGLVLVEALDEVVLLSDDRCPAPSRAGRDEEQPVRAARATTTSSRTISRARRRSGCTSCPSCLTAPTSICSARSAIAGSS
jgi:hypothetical protein